MRVNFLVDVAFFVCQRLFILDIVVWCEWVCLVWVLIPFFLLNIIIRSSPACSRKKNESERDMD
jgi:hypothetical protein